MPLLFSYGTLQQEPVQRSTFGRALGGEPDELVGFEQAQLRIDDPEFVTASGKALHAIVRFNGRAQSRVRGTVFELSDEELARADRYEPAGYRRIATRLASGKEAWVYAEDAVSTVGSRRWAGIAAIAGAVYAAIGLWFPNPAAGSEHQFALRLAAWIVSGVVFAAHISYEQLQSRSSVRATALHATLAAALGAFLLAAGAAVRAWMHGSERLVLHAIALVAWPLLVATPAFLVALAAAAVLARVRPGRT
jgi:gamma-glutamylcyclotransferase (GGCT)/AIG2-like uncharacterized protein YtfP